MSGFSLSADFSAIRSAQRRAFLCPFFINLLVSELDILEDDITSRDMRRMKYKRKEDRSLFSGWWILSYGIDIWLEIWRRLLSLLSPLSTYIQHLLYATQSHQDGQI